MITQAQLVEWKTLADQSTPGPWSVNPEFHGSAHIVDVQAAVLSPTEPVIDSIYYDGQHIIVRPVDSAFIAEARSSVPALIEECERLRTLLVRAIGLASDVVNIIEAEGIDDDGETKDAKRIIAELKKLGAL